MLAEWFGYRHKPLTQEQLFCDVKYHYTLHQYIAKMIDLKKLADQPVLEIGSGHGTFAVQLRKLGFHKYIGIDDNTNNINFLTNTIGPYFKKQTLRGCSQTQSEAFSAVFSFNKLQSFENPLEAIDQIHQLLPKGGKFVGTTPYPFNRNVISDASHLHVLHPRNWKRLFHLKKFRKVNTYPVSLIPYFWRVNPSLNPIIPAYIPGFNLTSMTLIIAEKGH